MIRRQGWGDDTHGHLRKPIARERVCKHCGRGFVRVSRNRILGKKYCSQTCQRAYLRAQGEARRATRELKCPTCQGPFFSKWIGRGWSKFCSGACRRIGRRSTLPGMRREGQSDRARGAGWKLLAAQVRVRDGHRCRRCGAAQQPTDKPQFPVDHIVPWRAFTDKTAANALANLVTLCRSCHSRKTSAAERLYLKGDMIAFEQYKQAIFTPWTPAKLAILDELERQIP